MKVVLNVIALGTFAAVLVGALLFAFVDAATGDIFGALIPLAFVGYAVYAVVRRGFKMRRLSLEGVETTGVVTRKLNFAPPRALRYQIKYAYRDSLGKEHHRVEFVSQELYDSLEVGSPVQVVYLPSRPSVSALLSDVENARRALRRSSHS